MRYFDWLLPNWYANCCLYKVDPPDDEQQACLKLIQAYF